MSTQSSADQYTSSRFSCTVVTLLLPSSSVWAGQLIQPAKFSNEIRPGFCQEEEVFETGMKSVLVHGILHKPGLTSYRKALKRFLACLK